MWTLLLVEPPPDTMGVTRWKARVLLFYFMLREGVLWWGCDNNHIWKSRLDFNVCMYHHVWADWLPVMGHGFPAILLDKEEKNGEKKIFFGTKKGALLHRPSTPIDTHAQI